MKKLEKTLSMKKMGFHVRKGKDIDEQSNFPFRMALITE